MIEVKTRAQTISTDALVAMALFLGVVIFFFIVGDKGSDDRKIEKLETEASKLVAAVSGQRNATSSLIAGAKIDVATLEKLAALDYNKLRDAVGVDADFCIHFEDKGGNLIEIMPGFAGLGSYNVRIGNTICGKSLNEGEIIICEEAENTGECDRLGEFGMSEKLCCAATRKCCA
ncbi:hypothetical protein HYX10_02945 [Candidatus Woesearchaeota archaeon]|nr:hypothetical protein [Candidatus Woesearchaeota archaeon]